MSLENLTHFGLRAGVDMRPTLIRVLTDLYVQKLSHTPEEERHYTELALRLLDVVDVTSRVAVAERLSRHLAPPPRVIARLAADLSPQVALLVRRHPVPAQKAREPAASLIAPGRDIAEPVTPVADVIAEVTAAVGTIADTDFANTDNGHGETVEATDTPEPTAVEIAGELNERFFAASAEERRLILLNLHIVVPAPPGRTETTADSSISRRLESAALGRNREDFVQQLALTLHIPRIQARRIVNDELGEPVVVVAKALKIPRDIVYRILLFVNTSIGHSVDRVHALAALYDEMTVQAAEHMVAIWQSLRNEERPRPQHHPLHWNDERARARTATAAVRRAPSSQRASGRHEAS